jgi:hypothetical protein
MRTRKLLSALAALALTASLAQPALAATQPRKPHAHQASHKAKGKRHAHHGKRHAHHGKRHARKAAPARVKPAT